jgi:hypothetical protein
MKQLIDVSALSGFSIYNEEYQLGLLYYYPTEKHKLRAQIWNLSNDDVLFETIIHNWKNAVSVLLTFKTITGGGTKEEVKKWFEEEILKSKIDFSISN